MARYKKIDFRKIAKHREELGENQSDFWARFGVTQSGGSRYENCRSIPAPTAILMALWLTGKIDDEALAAARKSAAT